MLKNHVFIVLNKKGKERGKYSYKRKGKCLEC